MEPRAGEAVGAILNGQWRLIRLIGEGGLAAVYEADSLQGQGKRAIKLLHPQFMRQRAIVERFYSEAKACFTLRHPNIAGVEAYAYAEDGSPYIVMELLQGLSLEDYLQRGQPMAPEMAAPLAFAVLQALSVAHGRGIVHRDLKPANLFLVPDGQGRYTIKVLDFGIAKVMDLAGGMGSKTRTGAVLGTPGYMSPEQVKNAKAVDARTDLWAAGVVFYEMLTCQHPYGSNDQLARMVAVLREKHKPIASLMPHLADWDPFFDKALAREPEDRFQSAEEMAVRLREKTQGTPARFVPDGLQTVAIPMMPDMTAGRMTGQPTPPPTSPPARAPGTQVSEPPPPMASSGVAAASAVASYSPQTYAGQAVPTPPVAQQAAQGSLAPSAPVPLQTPSTAPPSPNGPYAQPQNLGYPPAPMAGATRPTSTQISAGRPAGTPTIHSDAPPVFVEEAREEEPPSLVWWAVALVAAGTFALGLLLGYVLGAP